MSHTHYDLQTENWALQEELEEATETISTHSARLASQAAHIERLRQEVRAKDQLLLLSLRQGNANANNNNGADKERRLEAEVASLSEALDLVQRGYRALRAKTEKLEGQNVELVSMLAFARRRLRELDDGVGLLREAVVPATQMKGGGFRLEVKRGYRAIENLLRVVPGRGSVRVPIVDAAAQCMTVSHGGSLMMEAGGQPMPIEQKDKSVATNQSSTDSVCIASSAARRERDHSSVLEGTTQAQRCRVLGKRSTTAYTSEAAAPKEPPSFETQGNHIRAAGMESSDRETEIDL
ncbi:MAG: hypothetical protein Q9184_002489 [Pyrenodesmia sp. 2 TL-2023]